ncbi:MAG: CHRD domain-containing protein [Acidobacteriota bacterium]
MKRTAGFTAALLATLLIGLAASARAEVYTATLLISPLNEVPPITTLNATGVFVVTVTVNRDASGNITGGSVNFLGNVNFPTAVTITGMHLHENVAGANGPVRFDSGINGNSTKTFANGVGLINETGQVTSTDGIAALGRLLAKPSGFYFNIHSQANPSGAMRAQLSTLTETLTGTVAMTTAAEVLLVTNVTASGTGTVTINPKRNAQGAVIGEILFTVNYDVPAGSVISDFTYTRQPLARTARSGLIPASMALNTVTTATGKGFVNIPVPVTTQAAIDALGRLLANPAGFYVNMHTQTNASGVIRGQLAALTAPPVIQLSNTHFLEAGGGDATVSTLITGIDLSSSVLINGQPVTALPDLTTGAINITIPAALRANAGTLLVQVRNGQGVLSAPLTIVVAPTASVNAGAFAGVDAAKFSAAVAPESIAAGFGSKLASQTLAAPRLPLSNSLDGTSVYVNGIAAKLFFVSAGQINFLVPSSTLPGPAQVVVLAKDGSVSRGTLNVSQSAPALFTRLFNGTGAPAAVASADGQSFNIVMANADGTPVQIDAGNFVMLFGTGLRYGSTPMAMTIGGTAVTPTFVGAQGSNEGLDQINLQIPASLAGKGDADLVFTLDGKTSNTVKLRINIDARSHLRLNQQF